MSVSTDSVVFPPSLMCWARCHSQPIWGGVALPGKHPPVSWQRAVSNPSTIFPQTPTSSLAVPINWTVVVTFLSSSETLSVSLPAECVSGPCRSQRKCTCCSIFPTWMWKFATTIIWQCILQKTDSLVSEYFTLSNESAARWTYRLWCG